MPQPLICSECREVFRGVDSLRSGKCEHCHDQLRSLYELRRFSIYQVRHPDPEVMEQLVEAHTARVQAELAAMAERSAA